MEEQPRINLDHAATTAVAESVLEEMLPLLRGGAHPNSVHAPGRQAKAALAAARERVGSVLGVRASGVVFTGNGTEACNLAVRGMALAQSQRGRHIVTSTVEHHAVWRCCQALEEEGFEVDYLPVDGRGLLSPEQVLAAVRDDTVLVALGHANGETGGLQPVTAIAAALRERGVRFFCDAVLSVAWTEADVSGWGVDALAVSGHKVYGPQGIGALALRAGVRIRPQVHGGGQEKNRRSGTQFVAGAAGLARALELCVQRRTSGEVERLTRLRDRLAAGLLERIPEAVVIGPSAPRMCNHVSVSVPGVNGEAMILALDAAGVCASTGSACASGSMEPSHVMNALGLSPDLAQGAVRFTPGFDTTEEEIESTLAVVPEVVERLRRLSP